MPAGVRSLSALGPAFSDMADAATKANVEAINRSTKKLGKFVDAQGARHRIKGRSGKPVPLSSKTDVRAFKGANGPVVTGAVRGIPEGFWVIVEYGSSPHLITRRGSRTTRSGRVVSGLYTPSKTLRLFSEGHSFSEMKPLGNSASGFGPYQWVMHPGHGSQGKPWETAMAIGGPVIANEVAYEQTRAQAKAFLGNL